MQNYKCYAEAEFAMFLLISACDGCGGCVDVHFWIYGYHNDDAHGDRASECCDYNCCGYVDGCYYLYLVTGYESLVVLVVSLV